MKNKVFVISVILALLFIVIFAFLCIINQKSLTESYFKSLESRVKKIENKIEVYSKKLFEQDLVIKGNNKKLNVQDSLITEIHKKMSRQGRTIIEIDKKISDQDLLIEEIHGKRMKR